MAGLVAETTLSKSLECKIQTRFVPASQGLYLKTITICFPCFPCSHVYTFSLPSQGLVPQTICLCLPSFKVGNYLRVRVQFQILSASVYLVSSRGPSLQTISFCLPCFKVGKHIGVCFQRLSASVYIVSRQGSISGSSCRDYLSLFTLFQGGLALS